MTKHFDPAQFAYERSRLMTHPAFHVIWEQLLASRERGDKEYEEMIDDVLRQLFADPDLTDDLMEESKFLRESFQRVLRRWGGYAAGWPQRELFMVEEFKPREKERMWNEMVKVVEQIEGTPDTVE